MPSSIREYLNEIMIQGAVSGSYKALLLAMLRLALHMWLTWPKESVPIAGIYQGIKMPPGAYTQIENQGGVCQEESILIACCTLLNAVWICFQLTTFIRYCISFLLLFEVDSV